MRVKKLSKEIQSLFCSSVHLTNYKKAVEELVYNSIDAKATSIAVRVNLFECTIQVIDNGCGIHKRNYNLLGQDHATSKYVDLTTFKSAPNSYGYRGQSLANIISISQLVKITSRIENTDETWIKIFFKGKETNTKKMPCRPCKGTTVEVIGFLYNLVIQRQAVHVAQELQDIKTFLKHVTLIHSNVSLSLRDDNKNEIVLQMHKNRDIYHKLQILFNIAKSDLIEIKIDKNEYKASVFIGKKSGLHHHWIFLNNRFISNSKLHQRIQDIFLKTGSVYTNKNIKLRDTENVDGQPKYNVPFYIIFVSCPYYDYDLISNGNQSILEFKDWTAINQLLEKVGKFYSGDLKLQEVKTTNLKNYDAEVPTNFKEEVKNIMHKILGNNSKKLEVKQMQKGVNGKPVKRKNKRLQKPKSIILSSKKIEKVLTNQTLNSIKNKKNVNTIKINENNLKSPIIYSISGNERNKLFSNSPLALKIIQQHNNVKNVLPNKTVNYKIDQIAYKDQKQKRDYHNNNLQTPFKKKHECSTIKKCDRIKKSTRKCVKKAICNCTVRGKNHHGISKPKRIIPLHSKHNSDANISFLKSRDLLKTVLETPLNIPHVSRNIERNMEQNCKVQSSIGNNQYLTYYSHKYYCDQNDKTNRNELLENQERTMLIDEALKFKPEPKYRINRFISKQSVENFGELKNYKIYKQNATGRKNTYPNLLDFTIKYANSTIDSVKNKSSNYCSFKTFYNKVLEDDIQVKNSKNVGLIYTITSSNVTMNVSNHIISNFNNNINEEIYDSKRSKDFVCGDINIKNTKVVFISNTPEPKKIKINNTLTTDSLLLSHDANDKQVENDCIIFDTNKCDFNFMQGSHHSKENNIQIFSQSMTSSNLHQNFSVPCAQIEFKDQRQENGNTVVTNNLELTFTKNILPWKVCEIVFSPNVHTQNSNINVHYNHSLLKDNDNSSITDNLSLLNTKSTKCKPALNKNYEWDNIYQNNESRIDEFEKELHDISFFDKASFNFKQRLRFLPKGMSPIFEHCNTKSFGNYKSETEYFNNNLYNDFIDNVQAISEVYETKVQNATKMMTRNIEKLNHKVDKDISSLTFTSESLKRAMILSQVDNKFIATVLKGNSGQSNYLILLDQHAVDERVRLEDNLKDYFNGTAWKSIPLDDISVKVTDDDVMYLHNYREKFALLGLQWSFLSRNELKIHAIPVAIVGKHARDVGKIFTAVKNLIFEEISNMKSQKCVSLYPRSIMDLVFSEACRYAIKFGDKLSKEKCMELIDCLSACKIPFQCAHGRPVMAVITDLTSESRQYTINQAALLKIREKIKK